MEMGFSRDSHTSTRERCGRHDGGASHKQRRELWSGYDISGVASNYQAIAGILAGFTFAAITVVLDRSHRHRIAADERGARVAVLVPPVVASFAEIKLMDLAVSLGSPETQQPLQPLWDQAHGLAVPIGLSVMALCGACWLLGSKRRHSAAASGRIARGTQTALPYITIGFVMGARIHSVVGLPTADPTSRITAGQGWTWVLLLTGMVLFQSVALAFQKGVEGPGLDAEETQSPDRHRVDQS